MAGRQRTFELIPTTVAAPSRPKPPMTSKAAKKAYQKATRAGPRMSRAERNKRDADEVARQNKEYEKEKNAAKAKIAREKKAAKALAEKNTRRIMGLPEPSKYVRASQPTISRFVRSGSKRTWDELDNVAEDSDATIDGLPAKRVATEDDSDDEFGEFPALSQPELLEKLDSSSTSIKEEKIVPKLPSPHKPTPPVPRKSSLLNPGTSERSTRAAVASKASFFTKRTTLKKEPSDTEFGESPSLSQCETLEREINSVTPPVKEEPAMSKTGSSRKTIHGNMRAGTTSRATPVAKYESPGVSSQEIAGMAATQLKSEAADAVGKSAQKTPMPPLSKPSAKVAAIPISSYRTISRTTTATNKKEPMKASTPKLQRNEPNVESGPSTSSKTLPKYKPAMIENPDSAAPRKITPATQEPYAGKSTNTSASPATPSVLYESVQTAQRMPLKERSVNTMPPPSIPYKTKKSTIAFAPSPDKTRRPKSPNLPPSATHTFLEHNFDDFYPSPSQQLRELIGPADDVPSNTQVAREISPVKPDADDAFADLFSTQDVSLSAEDLLEIETPSRAPPRMEESPMPVPEPAPASDTPRQDDASPFDPAPVPETRDKRRFFEEKDEDMLYAALHESKMSAVARDVQRPLPAAESPIKSKRTLQRAISDASNYGDDDFSGCSQELLALP